MATQIPSVVTFYHKHYHDTGRSQYFLQHALPTALRIIDTIVSSPFEPKYRTLRVSGNAKVRAMLASTPGLEDLLTSQEDGCGFEAVTSFASDGTCEDVLMLSDARVDLTRLRTIRSALANIAIDAAEDARVRSDEHVTAALADAQAQKQRELRVREIRVESADAVAAARAGLQSGPCADLFGLFESVFPGRDDGDDDDWRRHGEGKVVPGLRQVLENLLCYPGETRYHRINVNAGVYFAELPPSIVSGLVVPFLTNVRSDPSQPALMVWDETSKRVVVSKNDTEEERVQRAAGVGLAFLDAYVTHRSSKQPSLDDHAAALREARSKRHARHQDDLRESLRAPRTFIPDGKKERDLVATRLMADISGFMECIWELNGGHGFHIGHRQEAQRLRDKYKSDGDLVYLHAMRDDWEARMEQTKAVTGRSMIHTIRTVRSYETVEKD
eukprot:PhM_4_TR4567/c0_g1_i1/m.3902